MEAAAYLSSEDRAASVTVVGNTEVPFERSLGRAVGERIQKLFEENGVKFANKVNVKEFIGEDGQVKEVRVKSFCFMCLIFLLLLFCFFMLFWNLSVLLDISLVPLFIYLFIFTKFLDFVSIVYCRQSVFYYSSYI